MLPRSRTHLQDVQLLRAVVAIPSQFLAVMDELFILLRRAGQAGTQQDYFSGKHTCGRHHIHRWSRSACLQNGFEAGKAPQTHLFKWKQLSPNLPTCY